MDSEIRYQPLMVAGTGSHVGKSVLVMGLCRAFRRRGIKVAPFKAQNMALNSGITPQGGEMGRAQISQAEAAGLEPQVDMNPILLKPSSDVGSQVILNGKVLGNYKGSEFFQLKKKLAPQVMAAFKRLAAQYQLIVLEGAGSCAEVNLARHDLVNMNMAQRAGARVVLAADIDTGGVFAQVVGTLGLMPPRHRKLVAGVVINKFRGDPELFRDGVEFLERRTKKPVLGVLPWFKHISLPQEDGVVVERDTSGLAKQGQVRVGAVRLSHISNFTDLDCLAAEPSVSLGWVTRPSELAGLDLLILPGTKNTLAALADLKARGLYQAIQAYHQLGGRILGLCGGYQLLGARIADPLGVEGPPGEQEGLGLLPVETVMAADKVTTRARARCLPGLPFACPDEVSGYEIHMGHTQALGEDRPALKLTARLDEPLDEPEGQVSPEGRVVGTYLHGILDNDALRAGLLAWAGGQENPDASFDYAAFKDRQYDLLADLLERHLDLEAMLVEREA